MSNQFFLTEEENAQGQFDWNADLYAQKQQQFANDLENSTGYELWPTKPKFCEYDYHLIDPADGEFCASCSVVPGVPLYGLAELKYRTIPFTRYPTTVIDTEKIIKMRERVSHTALPVFIFFRFTDQDVYYRVRLDDEFEQTLNRNTKTTKDHKWELKPLSHIPVEKLLSIRKHKIKNG